jgi:hypothetical protein
MFSLKNAVLYQLKGNARKIKSDIKSTRQKDVEGEGIHLVPVPTVMQIFSIARNDLRILIALPVIIIPQVFRHIDFVVQIT